MPDLKLILMVWEVFTLCVSLLCYFVSSCTFFFHPVVTQTEAVIHGFPVIHYTKHLIPVPLAGSLPPASNSAFDISQPKAGHQQWSCHAVLSKQTLPPQTESACKAAVIQPWNLPTSQTHRIVSPLRMAFSTHPCFHHLSFLTLLLSMFVSISLSSHLPSVFCLSAASLLSLHLSSPPVTSCQSSRDSLSCCDGRGLWDTSYSFNDFAPRHRSAREIQLPFFNRMGTLTRATPLWNMCEFGYACAQTSKLVLISHSKRWLRHFVSGHFEKF